jgi:NAD(P)-dependent dehydrogenase (short-subunit alcohol dehydrogenase family)
MAGICQDRVVVVTGAGRGLGRSHALEFARQGARIVVNDLGTEVDGSGASGGPAAAVVAEIRSLGGEAVASTEDVSDSRGAQRLIETAIEAYGSLDTLVNNAGILRDRMLINMSDDEWDDVIRVHLRGTFNPSRSAATFWRERAKSGHDNDGRIINTSSATGLYGNPGQINYATAKGGIAAFTVVAAQELGRYGVTVNAIAPMAVTRMNANLPFGEQASSSVESLMVPESVSPLVAWLGSSRSKGVTGRIFNVHSGYISVAEGWRAGPSVNTGQRWDVDEVDRTLPGLLAQARPTTDISGVVAAL